MQVNHSHLPHWQTLKLILSSLIVFNFYLNINSDVKYNYSILIEIFDMVLIPMFVFLAAYTSKGISWNNWRAHLAPAFIIYFTFQTVSAITLYFTNNLSLKEYILFPQNGVWFFLAVPIWQSIFLFMPSMMKNKVIGILTILFFSIVMAYISVEYWSDITGFSSIIQYFPFFVMAYFFDDKKIVWMRQKAFYLVPIISILVAMYLALQEKIKLELIQALYINTFISYLLIYILSFITSVFISIAIICISSSSERFVKVSNNALGVYLIHPTICFLLLTGLNWLKLEIGLPLLILLTFLTIFLALYLANNPIIHWFLNPQIRSKR
ncbi:hypothetical protein B9T31_05150 [Acinetobacter sp. ANC 4558]|nr:hypothetical protein B9T31_05150 [Acinetobacter sp. ANC 4558]